MGNIGEPTREYEVEPLPETEPVEVPVEEPATPEQEPVPA